MRRRKNNKFVLTVVALILFLGLGYAFLQTDLTINGTGKIAASSWDIHFEDLTLNPNNVAPSTGDVAATIDSTTLTDITYTITLKEPGDFYEFEVAIVNSGTIDAMIGIITNKLNGNEISTTNSLPVYLSYSVAYSDGVAIVPNQLLEAGNSETIKVRLAFRTDIDPSDLPTSGATNTLSFGLGYVQADDSAQMVPHPIDFATDSWDTVVAAIKSGNTSNYHVGDTKTVELGNSLGTHTIRIVNTSTPAECSTTGFSQTACGFVLEFADIITIYIMNPIGEYKGTTYQYGWNVDGWPASSMYTYLNDTNKPASIINSLPEVLRNAIIDTTVISGHGSTSGETNFTSTDKLYLLSTVEVYGSNYQYDTVTLTETRQLDYYASIPVTASSYSGAIKQRNGSNAVWWLRSAYSNDVDGFHYVSLAGDRRSSLARNTHGVAPAFRIG